MSHSIISYMSRTSSYIITAILLALICSCSGVVELTHEINEEGDRTENTIDPYTIIMSLNNNTSPYPQGGDCWGDFFFQFVDGNSCVRVYNLSTKKLIQTVSIPKEQRGFVPKCHCNTVCFGSEYYEKGDDFPLIYVSTGYAINGYTGALVYHIKKIKEEFSIDLVQTLRFPEDKSSWTEFVPAGEYAYLCYTSEKVVFKINMPKLKEGDIIINREMALDSFQFPPKPDWMSTSRNQDRIYYQGGLACITGVPQVKEASAYFYLNFEKQERETIVDLIELGLKSESESIFVWRGHLCIAFVNQIVQLNL